MLTVAGFIDGRPSGTTEIRQAAGRFLTGERYVPVAIDGRHAGRHPLHASQVEAITPSDIRAKPGWISAFMPTSSLGLAASIQMIAPFHFAD